MSRNNHNLTKPTRRQKELLNKLRLTPDDWLVCCESENVITLYNKFIGKTIAKMKRSLSNEKD